MVFFVSSSPISLSTFTSKKAIMFEILSDFLIHEHFGAKLNYFLISGPP